MRLNQVHYFVDVAIYAAMIAVINEGNMTKNNAASALANEPTERTVVAHNNIGEAFIAIMNEVGYVQKKGELVIGNKLQYRFAGERQLIEALRPALIKHQVICIPSEAKSRESVVVTEDGKKTFRTVVDYTFVYTHVPSATHIQVAVVGEGVDTGDKSAYKAATGALKYALRQPFLIETGDEPEAHTLPEEGPPVFKNSALRKTFFDNVVKSFDAALSVAELNEVAKLNKPKFAEMDVGSEHDQLAVEELRKRYNQVKVRLESEAEGVAGLLREQEDMTPIGGY